MPVLRLYKKQFHFPAKKTLLVFGGVFCVLCYVVFFVYPPLLGWGVSALFGAGSLPAFWLEHPSLYKVLTFCVRFFYGICTVGTLDLLALFYTYKLLDELIVKSAEKGVFWRVGLRAGWRLLALHIAAGLLICLFLGWWKGFSVYSLIPSLASSSFLGNVWTAVWAVSLICFALGFATQETFSSAVENGWDIFKNYFLFWLVLLGASLLLLWGPVMLLGVLGLESGGVASAVLVLWGSLSYFVLFSGLLIWLFNRRDLFMPVETAKAE